MRRGLGLAILAAGAALAGCAATSSLRFDNPMSLSAADPPTVERAARQVLTELRFEIEYPNSAEGRVTTAPLTGASWFEFWRGDTRSAYQSAESSLHTTRRLALVSVTPAGSGSKVFVKITKQRQSTPDLGPRYIGETFNKFDAEDTELMRQNELARTTYTWVDQGRDDVLEQYILERIQTAVGMGSPR